MTQSVYTSLSWPTRLGMAVTFTLVVIATLAVSAVFFALFLVLAIPVGLWLWWQIRRLRRQAQREREPYIDAEYEIETEYEVLEDRRSPRTNTSSTEDLKD